MTPGAADGAGCAFSIKYANVSMLLLFALGQAPRFGKNACVKIWVNPANGKYSAPWIDFP